MKAVNSSASSECSATRPENVKPMASHIGLVTSSSIFCVEASAGSATISASQSRERWASSPKQAKT